MMEKLDYERRSWNIQAKVSHDIRNDTQTIKCIEILFKSLMQGKGLFCVAEQEKSHEKGKEFPGLPKCKNSMPVFSRIA